MICETLLKKGSINPSHDVWIKLSFDLSCDYYLYSVSLFASNCSRIMLFQWLSCKGITSFLFIIFTETMFPVCPWAVFYHLMLRFSVPLKYFFSRCGCGLPILDHHAAAAWAAFCHLFSVVLYSIPHSFKDDKLAGLQGLPHNPALSFNVKCIAQLTLMNLLKKSDLILRRTKSHFHSAGFASVLVNFMQMLTLFRKLYHSLMSDFNVFFYSLVHSHIFHPWNIYFYLYLGVIFVSRHTEYNWYVI